MTERIRELSFEERARWGECPVCHVKDGQACNWTIEGELSLYYPYTTGPNAHYARVHNAPREVKEVPCE